VRFPLLAIGRRRNEGIAAGLDDTPWTLTSNVAAAVGPDLTYVKVKQGDEVLYLSKGTVKMLKGKFEVIEELEGRDMEGWRTTARSTICRRPPGRRIA